MDPKYHLQYLLLMINLSEPIPPPKQVHNSDGVYPYIGADGRANYTYWADKQRAKEKITLQVEAGYGNDADNSKV